MTVLRPLRLAAGLLDTGFAAVANFAMGVFAVANLSTDALALYALLYSGLVIAQLPAAQVSYLPARLAVNLHDRNIAPRIWTDLWRGRVIILCSVFALPLAGLPLIFMVDQPVYAAMASSAALAVAVTPLAAHARASLHILRDHIGASIASGSQFVVSLSGYLLAAWLSAEDLLNAVALAAVPFGVLLVSNVAALIVATGRLRRAEQGSYKIPTFRTRLSYLGADIVAQVAGYVTNLVALVLLGASAVAALEAARVVASPVIVVASALSAVLVPAMIRTVRAEDPPTTMPMLGRFAAATVGLGLGYSLVVILFGNVLTALVGPNFSPALAASRAAAASIDSANGGLANLLYAVHQSVSWIVCALVTAVVSTVMLWPLVALGLGVYSVPIVQAFGSGLRGVAGIILLKRSL